jgi:hypothetical protein
VDDLEFRKRAVIDPNDQSAEFLEKTSQSTSNQRFVEQQRAFDRQLSETLNFKTPDNLAERIILTQQLGKYKSRQQQTQHKWLISGIAASLFALAISFTLWSPAEVNSSQLSAQIISHYYEDTHALNVHMDVAKNNIDTMLASYGGKLDGPIGKVAFLGHCIVGGHTGVHLVLSTQQGPVTVLILPTQPVNRVYELHDQQLSGIVYPSKKGSIAILAEHAEVISSTRQRLDSSLNWII